MAGDGDFLMNGQELATAVQHGARTIVVLLNNGMYGTIRMHQERDYPRHVSGSDLSNPDFAALARAYGYAGVRITRTADFEPELVAALEREAGTLIEVMLEPEAITTRATLSAITESALKKQEKKRAAWAALVCGSRSQSPASSRLLREPPALVDPHAWRGPLAPRSGGFPALRSFI
jgi:acetolactate synthase-1/2/3 large subunit